MRLVPAVLCVLLLAGYAGAEFGVYSKIYYKEPDKDMFSRLVKIASISSPKCRFLSQWRAREGIPSSAQRSYMYWMDGAQMISASVDGTELRSWASLPSGHAGPNTRFTMLDNTTMLYSSHAGDAIYLFDLMSGSSKPILRATSITACQKIVGVRSHHGSKLFGRSAYTMVRCLKKDSLFKKGYGSLWQGRYRDGLLRVQNVTWESKIVAQATDTYTFDKSTGSVGPFGFVQKVHFGNQKTFPLPNAPTMYAADYYMSNFAASSVTVGEQPFNTTGVFHMNPFTKHCWRVMIVPGAKAVYGIRGGVLPQRHISYGNVTMVAIVER